MKKTFSIGAAILRRRQSRYWSLQRLCDEAQNVVYPSALSAIEKETSIPSVLTAYALAKAFGTTVDELIAESLAGTPAPAAPAETAKRVPVVPWAIAADWAANPDISTLPSGTPWELPPENPPGPIFGLVVRDDTMQAPAGPTFPVGSIIWIDPRQRAEANDFVVGYTHNRQEPTFKKLVQDGSQRYLRALNQQFPTIQIDDNFKVIGVVTSMSMRVAKGFVH